MQQVVPEEAAVQDTEGKDLQAEVVRGTEESFEEAEEVDEKRNHRPGFIA